MMLGRIIGKSTTNDFTFQVDSDARKFDYVQVYHKEYDYVLCQIYEIEKDSDKTVAFCQIIGYNENGIVKKPRMPFDTGSEVLMAEDDFIRKVIKINEGEAGAYIGKLEGKDIDIYLDLNKVLTMHMAVLAKSGSGKSYAVGVLLEEMIKKKIPLVVIDPHGEYSHLRFKNDNPEDIEKLARFNLMPEKFEVQEYGDTVINKGVRPLKLNKKMTKDELLHLLPGKLSNSQLAVLYSAMKDSPDWSFESLLLSIDMEENNAKFGVMSLIDYLRSQEIFSEHPISYNEIVSSGKCSVLNLKGINPDVQEIIVYKICKDLFELRKKGKIPPFFLVIEEAHNYCPERSFGETKASKIIRNIASEGRKFGLGLCVISQRPARVDKSVLSQCSTQLILKVTNPNDLKALSASVEGLTSSTEKEIQNLPVGTALVTGLTDVPLLVNIRPKMSSHGGRAEKILKNENENFIDKVKEFEETKILPVIKPNTTLHDLRLMSDNNSEIKTTLIPCHLLTCKDKAGEFRLLIDDTTGEIIVDKENHITKRIPDLKMLNPRQIKVLKYAFKKKTFLETDIIRDINTDMEVSEDLGILENAGYILKNKNEYVLNENFAFSKLSNFQCFDVINYESISYDEKLEGIISFDEFIEKISGFTTVLDNNECFLVTYKTIS